MAFLPTTKDMMLKESGGIQGKTNPYMWSEHVLKADIMACILTMLGS